MDHPRRQRARSSPLPRAALPAATDKEVEALRAVALKGVTDTVKVEITEEPAPGGQGGQRPRRATYTVVVTSGTDREEYPGVTMKKGRNFIATKVNAASKLIKIEETGASLPDMRVAPGSYTLSVPSVAVEKISAGDFEGDVATRKGMGNAAALDEVTMLVMPDIVSSTATAPRCATSRAR